MSTEERDKLSDARIVDIADRAQGGNYLATHDDALARIAGLRAVADAAWDARGQVIPDREALATLIRAELAKDREGFGSCDFGATLADAILALLNEKGNE